MAYALRLRRVAVANHHRRQFPGNDFRLRFANHSRSFADAERVRFMLRLGILASTLPLLLLGVFAGDAGTAPRPCIALGDGAAELAPAPWQAGLHVSFTDDATRANVRVQIVDAPDQADFTVVDDIDAAEPAGCDGGGRARLIAITPTPSGADPVILLSRDRNADYRIFVRSRRITAREAAALIVGAHGTPPHVVAALDGRS